MVLEDDSDPLSFVPNESVAVVASMENLFVAEIGNRLLLLLVVDDEKDDAALCGNGDCIWSRTMIS